MGHSVLYTVGHSTHEFDVLVGLLRGQEVKRLVDVRTVPRSRRNPQFNRDRLQDDLPEVGIEYLHFPELGGLRKPRRDSDRNDAWRNASFRGFADYMLSPEFTRALDQLVKWGEERRTAFMCAESVPWRCHRSLISDVLTAQHHVEVVHLLGRGHVQPHRMTEFARVQDGQVTYPASQLSLAMGESRSV